jgi:hypothetical protein
LHSGTTARTSQRHVEEFEDAAKGKVRPHTGLALRQVRRLGDRGAAGRGRRGNDPKTLAPLMARPKRLPWH